MSGQGSAGAQSPGAPAGSCRFHCSLLKPLLVAPPPPASLPACARGCRQALLGTDAGALYELAVEEGGRKERLRPLYTLHGEAAPVAGLAQVGRKSAAVLVV